MWFSSAQRWNPGSFKEAEWGWPPQVVRPFRDALDPTSVPVGSVEHPDGHPPLITIRFDGSMERRDADPKDIKGRLFLARAGELVYSKIDVRNGAIGIVPPELPVVAVTAEYPVHRVRPAVADIGYVRLLVRSSGLRREILARISGASGRKRIMPSDLLDIEAPFPALDDQRAIVAHADAAGRALSRAESAAARGRREAEGAFLAGLGLALPREEERPKILIRRWSTVDRWGVLANQLGGSGASLESSSYPVFPLASALELVQYGTSEKANTSGKGVPVARIGNVKDGTLDMGDVKHVELSASTLASLALEPGDILIIRTSGSRDLVGTTAVVPKGLGSLVFASYLIRLRVNADIADPRYVSAFINGRFGRIQVEMLARQIMQNNINSEEIRALRLPLPPLPVQQGLADALADANRAADTLLAEARAARSRAMAEVDAMILGTLPVPAARG